mmetsp:Transcript_38798/g.93353  ORF Transcript_38798/g.93353 Transcript_38798/m.93353 type:complete len:147 (-) Transcript_38798:386-826(-)
MPCRQLPILTWKILFSLVPWAALALHTRLSSAMSIDPARPRRYSQDHGQDVIHIQPFSGAGITSILPVPSSANDEFYVGKKRGKIRKVSLPEDLIGSSSEAVVRVHDIEDAYGKPLKPYPVSLCGGGATNKADGRWWNGWGHTRAG